MGEAVPSDVDEMGGDLVAFGLAGVEPPLTGERDHADQCLGVERSELRVVPTGLERPSEDVLDLAGDVADQAGERARSGGHRRVTDQYPKAGWLPSGSRCAATSDPLR